MRSQRGIPTTTNTQQPFFDKFQIRNIFGKSDQITANGLNITNLLRVMNINMNVQLAFQVAHIMFLALQIVVPDQIEYCLSLN